MINDQDFFTIINSDNQFFWEGCKQKELRFQICSDCNSIRWPPSIMCPNCLSMNFKIISSFGKGTIYSFVVYHRAYHKSMEDEVPYVTAIVELEEGVRILSRIITDNTNHVDCGKKVELIWGNTSKKYPIPLFKLVEEI